VEKTISYKGETRTVVIADDEWRKPSLIKAKHERLSLRRHEANSLLNDEINDDSIKSLPSCWQLSKEWNGDRLIIMFIV